MPTQPQTTVFTFRPNGELKAQRMVEITAEPVEQHEAPALADRQSWFGPEEAVPALMTQLAFPQHDIDGVMGALYTNRIAARNAAITPEQLTSAAFRPSA